MLRIFVRVQLAKIIVQRWTASEDGASAIEYGLIAAGIAMAIIIAVFAIGDELSFFFDTIQSQIGSKTNRVE